MQPWSREALHNMKRGLDNSILQFFKRTAGTPSAPAAEAALSSAQASCMSFSENEISSRAGPPEIGPKNSLGSLTIHSSLGSTKTELYCLLSCAAANSGSGLGLPLLGSIKGQILALVFCLDLAKEKNALGLDFMLAMAWFSSNILEAE